MKTREYHYPNLVSLARKFKAEDWRLSRPLTIEECDRLAERAFFSDEPKKAVTDMMVEIGVHDDPRKIMAWQKENV